MSSKQQINRRTFLRLASMTAVGSAMAACVPTAPPAAQPAAQATAPAQVASEVKPNLSGLEGEITWMTQGNFEDPASTSYVQQNALVLIKKYQEQHPKIKVKLIPMPAEDTWNWIKQQAIAGSLSDVVFSWNIQMYWDTKLFMDFQEALNAPNPYSKAKSWAEDMTLGGDFVTGQMRGPGGAVFTIGMPLWGATNQIVIYYNLDQMKKAGITKIIPDSYAEWMDQLKKLKDAGFVPFNPGAGARDHFMRLYVQNLSEDTLFKQCDHAIDGNDIGQPDGIVSLKEAAWCTKKGIFSPKKHEAFRETLQLIKAMEPYWPRDWLAPQDTAAGDPWVQQKVAQDWNHGPWRVETLRADKNVNFEWGTFALPPVTKESSTLGTGAQVRALGGSTGSFLRLDLPFMIPTSTIQKGRLPLVMDFLHWLISPDNIQFWNENARPKGWDPTKQKFEEVFTDPVLQRELHGHYIPNPKGHDGQSIVEDQFTAQGMQVADMYYAGRTSLDDTLNQLEDIWNNSVKAQVQENPAWKYESW